MIKPLTPFVSLVPLCPRCPLLLLSPARAFAGRKARYAEIVRSERRPPNERASSSRVPSDFCRELPSRPPLLPSFFSTSPSSFFFFSSPATVTTASSSSSSYGGDGGFQRDVLAAANSMHDESSTVTDTAGQRSIAGGPKSHSLIERNLRTMKWHMLRTHVYKSAVYIPLARCSLRSRGHARVSIYHLSVNSPRRTDVADDACYQRPPSRRHSPPRANTSHHLLLHFLVLLLLLRLVVAVATGVADDRYRDAAPPRAPTTTGMSAMIRPTSGGILSHHWSATTSTAGIVRRAIRPSARRDAMAYRSRRRRRRRWRSTHRMTVDETKATTTTGSGHSWREHAYFSPRREWSRRRRFRSRATWKPMDHPPRAHARDATRIFLSFPSVSLYLSSCAQTLTRQRQASADIYAFHARSSSRSAARTFVDDRVDVRLSLSLAPRSRFALTREQRGPSPSRSRSFLSLVLSLSHPVVRGCTHARATA